MGNSHSREQWDRAWSSGQIESWDLLSQELFLALMRELRQVQGQRILEAGSGTGQVSLELARAGADVTLLDFAPKALEQGRRIFQQAGLAVRLVAGDIRQMPFPDSSFDVVWNAGVLEHYDPAGQAALVGEMVRVLKPGGCLIVFTPNPRCTPYQVGRWLMEVTGCWRYGWKDPGGSLIPLLTGAGLASCREYPVAPFTACEWMDVVSPAVGQVLRGWTMSVSPAGQAPGLGYLTATCGRKGPVPGEPPPGEPPPGGLRGWLASTSPAVIVLGSVGWDGQPAPADQAAAQRAEASQAAGQQAAAQPAGAPHDRAPMAGTQQVAAQPAGAPQVAGQMARLGCRVIYINPEPCELMGSTAGPLTEAAMQQMIALYLIQETRWWQGIAILRPALAIVGENTRVPAGPLFLKVLRNMFAAQGAVVWTFDPQWNEVVESLKPAHRIVWDYRSDRAMDLERMPAAEKRLISLCDTLLVTAEPGGGPVHLAHPYGFRLEPEGFSPDHRVMTALVLHALGECWRRQQWPEARALLDCALSELADANLLAERVCLGALCGEPAGSLAREYGTVALQQAARLLPRRGYGALARELD